MQDVFDIYTIIFLALAVFIFLRLRSVLGQRTGRERPPYDPFSARDVRGAAGDKVVTLPTRAVEQAAKPSDKPTDKPADKPAESAEPSAERWAGIAPSGSPIAAGLDAILAADKSFDPRHFLTGARAAYEMIVVAFAQGDRRTLREGLSKEVYDSFEGVIQERENHGETTETRFVSIDTTEIAGAEMRARTALVTVRFVSQLVSATRDKAGTVTDGNPDKVTDVTDVWTFARDASSRDPNWKLVATEAGH
jgi:predicted lipid-binding transport protein (Tim44 family)